MQRISPSSLTYLDGSASPTGLLPAIGGHITVVSTNGHTELIRVTSSTSTESLQQCIRAAFRLDTPHFVLRDQDGAIVPLDAGLLASAAITPNDKISYQLEVVQAVEKKEKT
jgi:hypothetical protein